MPPGVGRRHRLGLARAQRHDRVRAVQRELEPSGRRQVLDEVEPALPLRIVLEVAIPDGLVPVRAVAKHGDRRQARIRAPGDPRPGDLGHEVAAAVLVVQGVVVATRQERAHEEARTGARILELPAQRDLGLPVARHDLLGQGGAVLGAEGPARPGLGREVDQPRLAVRMAHIPGVALGAEREAAGGCHQLHLDAVHQHDAARRRRGRGEQERMVAPCAHAAHGARRKPAETIGLEPLGRQPLLPRHAGHDLLAPSPGRRSWPAASVDPPPPAPALMSRARAPRRRLPVYPSPAPC